MENDPREENTQSTKWENGQEKVAHACAHPPGHWHADVRWRGPGLARAQKRVNHIVIMRAAVQMPSHVTYGNW